jgi:hypothetical protein
MKFVSKSTYNKVNSRKVSVISLRLGPKNYFLERYKDFLFLKELSII